MSRLAFISGGDRGIGFSIAVALGIRGWRMTIASPERDRGIRAAEMLTAKGVGVAFIELDVSDSDSIVGARRHVDSIGGELQLLVNCAGITVPRDQQKSVESLRRVCEVNFMGAYALSRELLPCLIAGSPSRITNVSSGFGSLGEIHRALPDGGRRSDAIAYGISKAALNATTAYLAAELTGTGVTVVAVDPGSASTDFNGFRGEYPADYAAAVVVDYSVDRGESVSGGFFDQNGRVPW
ncbi:MAG: SDR family NAD(P)-dependent oxidoreductase [Candidatus Dormiibacterota bacterium]